MKRSMMLCYILQMQNSLIYFGAYKHYGATKIVINKEIKIVYCSIYDWGNYINSVDINVGVNYIFQKQCI